MPLSDASRTAHREKQSLRNAFRERDWNFWDAETDSLTHGIHRYSGKFIPQIARQAIELLTEPGDLIVDPYCGSGTTLLEAALVGRRAIGFDLSPLAVLIATAKITPVPGEKLRELRQQMSDVVSEIEGADLFSSRGESAPFHDWRLADPWFKKWFQELVLRDLVAIHQGLELIQDTAMRRIGLVAFSDILRRSSNAHQGYPNVMFDSRGRPRPRPGRLFLKALRQICDDVGQLSSHLDQLTSVTVQEADARNLPLIDGTADAIVSHPPYIGSIPYAEYGALSLKWLGADPKGLDKQLTGGQRQSRHVVARFTSAYAEMIRTSYRVLKPGGCMFLLVGNPVVKGSLIDLSEMTRLHAADAGFSPIVECQRSGKNRRSNQMGDETLLVFEKR
jgi:SAM-dependent methyltransferase